MDQDSGSKRLELGLWPLRVFLGATFLYAGIDKLADPAWFASGEPGSFALQARLAAGTSPIQPLVQFVAENRPALWALLIAAGELLIGAATLLRAFPRAAAAGGFALSFGLFLALTFHVHPYYLGNDLAYAAAWTPLVFARAVPVWELVPRWRGATPPDRAVAGRTVTRRTLLQGAAAGSLGAGAFLLGTALRPERAGGRELAAAPTASAASTMTEVPPTNTDPSPTTSRATTTTAAGVDGATASSTAAGGTTGTLVDPASVDVPDPFSLEPGELANFLDRTGAPAIALGRPDGSIVRFQMACTHAGCLVTYVAEADSFACPCHGAVFSATDGTVLFGPAPAPLPIAEL